MRFVYSILTLIAIFSTSFYAGCKKGFGGLSANASEIFWVKNNGADMPVRVEGNTLSKIIVLIVHGGPGDGSFNYADYQTAELREKYAVAFWDQRDAGNSAGNNNLNDLSLPQMISDLEAVVAVLKFRYEESHLYLCAHSFGGLLAAGYLVKSSNQDQVRGWIEIDGAHNYPLCNSSSRQMLMDTARSEIDKGHHASQWQGILDYCTTHDPLSSYEIASQTERYARLAEGYMGVKQSTPVSLAEDPSSLLADYYDLNYTSAGKNFMETVNSANYSGQLYEIQIPSLLLWGQYDFVVPPAVGEDGINNLGSSKKKLVFCPNSGHHPMETDTNLVQDEIINFIESCE